ncbi:hypothetical protein GGX14DRAFT_400616 [Mycena pura]|uniref:Uncharacterized protein n=1 Tax=Mycena pura TaxID=153505 RepID=A0AAD6Y4B5_9AGAR|nr:hypothetical protein GGX14DRAFT_400616 [Mycena pura]
MDGNRFRQTAPAYRRYLPWRYGAMAKIFAIANNTRYYRAGPVRASRKQKQTARGNAKRGILKPKQVAMIVSTTDHYTDMYGVRNQTLVPVDIRDGGLLNTRDPPRHAEYPGWTARMAIIICLGCSDQLQMRRVPRWAERAERADVCSGQARARAGKQGRRAGGGEVQADRWRSTLRAGSVQRAEGWRAAGRRAGGHRAAAAGKRELRVCRRHHQTGILAGGGRREAGGGRREAGGGRRAAGSGKRRGSASREWSQIIIFRSAGVTTKRVYWCETGGGRRAGQRAAGSGKWKAGSGAAGSSGEAQADRGAEQLYLGLPASPPNAYTGAQTMGGGAGAQRRDAGRGGGSGGARICGAPRALAVAWAHKRQPNKAADISKLVDNCRQ